jgi:hypothetical protein
MRQFAPNQHLVTTSFCHSLPATAAAGCPARVRDDTVITQTGAVSVCTMHLAKGLEFRAVAVMACDERRPATAGAD